MKLDLNEFKLNLGINKEDAKEDELLNSILARAKDKIELYLSKVELYEDSFTIPEKLNSIVLSLAERMYRTKSREAIASINVGYQVHYKEDELNDSEKRYLDNYIEMKREKFEKSESAGEFNTYDWMDL